jgi:hypothetical protein
VAANATAILNDICLSNISAAPSGASMPTRTRETCGFPTNS